MAREMKHSGIEWIGEIPKEWKTQKFKTITKSMKSGGTPTSSNAAFYNEDGTPWVAIGDMCHCGEIFETQKHLTEEGLKDKSLEIYPCGTLLYSIYASVGKVSVLKIPAAINQAILALSLNEKAINVYGKYLLVSMEDYVFSLANGNTQFNLNAGIVANLIIPLPPLSEQQKIANYLDKVCGEVDEMIALQEQMIEELKAYKQSVITEAVTKGLNPNVPMKDSGNLWIGTIPMHWNIGRIGDIGDYKKGPFGSAITLDMFIPKGKNTIKVYEQQNAIKKDWKLGYYYISEEYFINKLQSFEVLPNDLIVSCAGTIGEVYQLPVDIERGIINQALMRMRISDSINLSYFLYIFDLILKGEADRSSNGTAIKNIPPFSIFKKILIPLPPISEQQSIASYLDTKCAEIDALIAIKQAKIDELKDYKKSVIYEYVTGKKEVE